MVSPAQAGLLSRPARQACLSADHPSSKTERDRKFEETIARLGKEKLFPKSAVLPKSVSAISDSEWQQLASAVFDVNSCNPVFSAVDAEGKRVTIVKYVRSRLETPLSFSKHVEKGGLGKREVLASEVNDFLNWELVPKTKLGQTAEEHLVTLQMYLADYLPPTEAPLEWHYRRSWESTQKMQLFDLLMGSIDRHSDNLMINATGKLALIDNGGMLTLSKRSPYAKGILRPMTGYRALKHPLKSRRVRRHLDWLGPSP